MCHFRTMTVTVDNYDINCIMIFGLSYILQETKHGKYAKLHGLFTLLLLYQ